jgi:hypothetical protein
MLTAQKKTIQTDNTALRKVVKEGMPHLADVDSIVQVVGEGDFAVSTKREREEARTKIRTQFQKTLGMKVSDVNIDKMLDTLGDGTITVSLEECREQDFQQLIEWLPKDVAPKVEFAIEGAKLFGVRFKYKGIDMCSLMVVAIDEDTLWLPITIKEDADGEISVDDCMRINSFVLTILFEYAPNTYAADVTGPRGGQLTMGRIFTRQIKTEGQKVQKDMPSGCVISY